MQENEFEEEINNNMDGFGIEPSAQVWLDVERRIGKEKKRRFAIWYWLLLLLLAGGISTAVLFTQDDKSNNKVYTTQPQKNVSATNSNTGIDTALMVNTTNEHTASSKKITAQQKNTDDERAIKEKQTGITKNENRPLLSVENEKNVKGVIMHAVIEESVEHSKAEKSSSPDLNNQPKKFIEHQRDFSINSKDDSKPLTNTMNTVSMGEKNKDSYLEMADTAIHKLAIADSMPSQLKEKRAPSNTRKWKRGVHIAAGRSGFSDGILSLNKSLRAEALYNTSTGSGQGISAAVSPVNPSFYWGGGVFMQKSINKKLDISIGVDYNFLSTKNNIGSRVDSSRIVILDRSLPTQVQVDHFYRPAGASGSKSYSNQFHFIGLSADVAWKIIVAKRFTMYWENGISYNRLISSNMLHYNQSLPGYYKNNSQLTSNQFVFKTGLLFPLTKSLALKPFISYQLLPLFKNKQSANTHFSIVGLQVKYFLKNNINSATK